MSDRSAQYDTDRVDVSGPSRLESVDAETFDASGHTTVTGDVHAARVDVSGATEIDGELRANRVSASGTTTVNGQATIETLNTSGSVAFESEVTAATIDASGRFSVTGNVSVEDFDASGSTRLGAVMAENVEVSGDTRAEEMTVGRLTASGAIDIDDLDAETVSVNLGSSTARITHLDAESVTVARRDSASGVFGVLLRQGDGRLTVETLVAKEVDLVETTVAELTAETAIIGPGCHIEQLRADEWEIDSEATVEQKEQVSSSAA